VVEEILAQVVELVVMEQQQALLEVQLLTPEAEVVDQMVVEDLVVEVLVEQIVIQQQQQQVQITEVEAQEVEAQEILHLVALDLDRLAVVE
tara:strand:+ start:386 stop:658 length:273 start_codon:yes stop_codon:yes gene_type:complete